MMARMMMKRTNLRSASRPMSSEFSFHFPRSDHETNHRDRELPSNMGPASNDEAAGPPQDLLLPGPPSDDEVEYTFVPDGDNDNDNGDGNGNGDDEDYERNLAFLHSVYSRQPGDDEDEDEGLI